MKTPMVPLLLASLCLPPLLGGCGPARPQVLVRPQIIEVPVTRYVPVPPEYAAPIAAPAVPEKRCTYHGQPAVCVLDALATIPLWRAALEQANHDRADVGKLGGSNKP